MNADLSRGPGVRVPLREEASPLSPPPRIPDPYRVLFPIGVVYALIGAGVWPLHAAGALEYPGPLHRLLMIQGFEQSFVLGFLLTAMPGFTRGERCRPAELATAAATAIGFGVAALAGWTAVAALAFLASVALLLTAGARRVQRAPVSPPLEMMFVGFGLLLGAAGGFLQLAGSLGAAEPVSRFGDRLISLGMVLSLVLGVGGLLVPAFVGMRDPLVIPGIAGPHERRGRARFYGAILAGFSLAFVLEAVGALPAGAWLRALSASAVTLLVWKLWRPPGRQALPAFVLWGSGWLVLGGLWTMALAPAFSLGALHMVFIGGFGMLTLGIATRVTVVHGHHPPGDEDLVLGADVVMAVLAALLSRLGAEWWPRMGTPLLGASGALWVVGWTLWSLRALPRIARVNSPPPRPG